ncbi:hypothetical protein [Micropruina sp.]|uniref:hypothetical protein n=1 Tax=Micropruina sp. TaxID=2737536 RepID=UPI0039E29632
MYRVPTIESIAIGKSAVTEYVTPVRLAGNCLVVAFGGGVLAYAIPAAHPIVSVVVTLIGVAAGFCIPLLGSRPAEFRRRRARDLEPGELVEHGAGSMGSVSTAPVLCRLNVDDGAAQVEVTLAGISKPMILRPDAVVTVVEPLWSSPAAPSEQDACATLDEIYTGLLSEPTWLTDQTSTVVEAAERLGLVERAVWTRELRWTEAGQAAQTCLLALSEANHQVTEPAVVVRVSGDLHLHVAGATINADRLIEQVFERATTEAQRVAAEALRAAVQQEDPQRIRNGLLGVGRDVVIGILGSAAWEAIRISSGL